MGGRAAIYLRVSKSERHTENQRPDIERLITVRRLELVAEYEEKASAAKARPVFDRMTRDAHRGAFDVLVVWALDRFGRSMIGNLQAVLDPKVRQLFERKISQAEIARRLSIGRTSVRRILHSSPRKKSSA